MPTILPSRILLRAWPEYAARIVLILTAQVTPPSLNILAVLQENSKPSTPSFHFSSQEFPPFSSFTVSFSIWSATSGSLSSIPAHPSLTSHFPNITIGVSYTSELWLGITAPGFKSWLWLPSVWLWERSLTSLSLFNQIGVQWFTVWFQIEIHIYTSDRYVHVYINISTYAPI